ncbi:probable glycosyltransferase At5g03795 isoform X2 [Cornus florida]|uniref:probable glycosyltransferase At5g03795 isoform X2 n=1 Tax=Cornus florida TaxID=4283 RepID=UPI00289C217C|nr:probable glycosyltransferase At5g03795 isoform X2 [Cornus florida]
MEIGSQFQGLCHAQIQRLLLILGILAAAIILFQLFALSYEKHLPSLPHANKGSVSATVDSATLLNISKLTNIHIVHGVVTNANASDLKGKAWNKNEMNGEDTDYEFASDGDGESDNSSEISEERNSHNEFRLGMDLTVHNSSTIRTVRWTDNSFTQEQVTGLGLGALEQVKESDNDSTLGNDQKTISSPILGGIQNRTGFGALPPMSPRIFTNGTENLDADSRSLLLPVAANVSAGHTYNHTTETQPKDASSEPMQKISVTLSNNSSLAVNSIKERRTKTISIYQMNLLLIQSSVSSNSMRPRWSSARDRQLQDARLQIEKPPIIRNAPGLHASLFRNFSMFKRSYEMMERMLKVYIYREGEKPIFHEPYLRGIYASEGWFMKLIEGNKQFVFASQKDLEKYLKHHVDMIAGKYRFWNRTGGADHFSVSCHDWAPRMTRNSMGSCIRALCNTNIASGFKIGKDVSLPVTYVRNSQDPLKGIGGKPPSERHILVFFAGGMHGYLRPILLQYWKDKEPDMKIFGPMPRDIEGKALYREHMKSSKYCICARGYEVHTPRVVESILYECVPVIISDNYVPPFFEILDWEAFSVFIPEKDIPNLRNILLSIPEEKYLAMQQRVKMVQQHFLWHKQPVKYDLFHMILHSVWYNRVFQLKTR